MGYAARRGQPSQRKPLATAANSISENLISENISANIDETIASHI